MKKNIIFILLCSFLLCSCNSELELENMPTVTPEITSEVSATPTPNIRIDEDGNIIIDDPTEYIEITDTPIITEEIINTEIPTPTPTTISVITEEPTVEPTIVPTVEPTEVEDPTPTPLYITPELTVTEEPTPKTYFEPKDTSTYNLNYNVGGNNSLFTVVMEYPNKDSDTLTVNGSAIGTAVNTSFTYGDLSYTRKLEPIPIDNSEYSNINKIYSSVGINFYFTDKYEHNKIFLGNVYPVINTIQIGNQEFKCKDIIVPTAEIYDLINKFPKLFNLEIDNMDEIKEVIKDNEFGGNTYTWSFTISDLDGEYTKKELNDYINDGFTKLNGKVYIEVVESALGEVESYYFNYIKSAHLIQKPITDTLNMTTQDGYYYNKNNIKLLDGSVIGYSSITFEIHNVNSNNVKNPADVDVAMFKELKKE